MKIYLVGGAVRDELMGLPCTDRDWLIVGATPDDVQQLLIDGYEQVGADFPVFLHPETKEEYALARTERKKGSGYHGFEVDSSSSVSIEDDLMRRDLTINSMAYDVETKKLIDPYNGYRDLVNGILRNTSKAFGEDPLRVLRLARFAARFPSFRLASETVDLCKQLCESGELNHLAIERVWLELEKGLCEKYPDVFIKTLFDVGAIKNCNALAGMFGDTPVAHLASICKILNIIPKEERLVVGVATLAIENAKLPNCTKRLADLYNHLCIFKNVKGTAQDLMLLLKRVGALRESSSFNDFCHAVTVLELSGHRVKFSAKELEIAAEIMRLVKAQAFPPSTGKALGDMLDLERIKMIDRALSLTLSYVDPKHNSDSL